MMEIERIEIVLTGKCDLERLREMKYEKLDPLTWRFIGRVHVYSFIANDADESIVVRITKIPNSHIPLIPEVTMHQMNSWVLDSIKMITI